MPIETPSVGGRVFSRFVQLLSRSYANCRIVFVVFLILASLVGAGTFGVYGRTAVAAPTTNLNFQARLLNASGGLVPDGFYNIQFNLYYQSSGGASLWSETYLNSNTQGVRIKNGYFSANLGSVVSFPNTIDWDQEIWLGMTVRGIGSCAFGSCTPADSEMTPRFKLTAVPYAFKAAQAASVQTAATNTVSTNSNNVTIQSGNALGATSNSGNILIDSGSATGTAGQILIGTTNSSAILLGRTGTTTTVQGSLAVNEASSFNGNVTIGDVSSDSLTVNSATTFNSGLAVTEGDTFTNAGSSLYAAKNISNLATGGNIGTASATVDGATTFNINQTTTGQTLTLPAPTNATAGRIVYVNNVGTASFTMYGSVIGSGQSNAFIWNGTAWVTTVSLSGSVVNVIGTLDSVAKSADGAVIGTNAIYLQSADASFAGLVNTSAQTFAGTKTFNGGIVIASGQTLTVIGGNTASRPASPTEGMVYFDTTTKRLITYANGKWQGDRSDAILVAASNSSQTDKDAADYVADGNTATAADGDQVQINQALTAAAGRKVVLLAGTYVVDASISVPNNTTLAGVGNGTVVEFANLDGVNDYMIENSDQTTGTGVVIRDMKLDGRSDINTGFAGSAIYFNNMGSGAGTGSRASGLIQNMFITRFPFYGIRVSNSVGNKIIDNQIYYSKFLPIYLESGSNGTEVSRNRIISSYGNEVIHIRSDHNTITNNSIEGSTNGILTISQYNVISNNVLAGTATDAWWGLDIEDSYNTVTGNIIKNYTYGISLGWGDYSTVAGNTVEAGTNGQIGIEARNYSSVTGNVVQGFSTSGITAQSNNTITGNTIQGGNGKGISIENSDNIISSNRILNTGGATTTSGIYIDGSDRNTINDNNITDSSCTTTCYAIELVTNGTTSATSDNNYLSGNVYSASSGTASINDLGTGTRYAGQTATEDGLNVLFRQPNSSTAFQVQNSAGAGVLTIDTVNGQLELGGASLAGQLVISDGSSNSVTILAAPTTGDYTATIPTLAANDTFCMFGLNNCAGTAPSLQIAYDNSTSPEITLNSTNGALTVRDALTPLSGNLLEIQNNDGTSNYFTVSTSGVSLGANMTLNLAGGNTASRPASPTEGMVYFDTTTKQLLTYANGKWQGDRSDAILVAANNSSQSDKDAADYVADGNTATAADGDQVQINQALTAAAGRKVVLLAGTYYVDGAIQVPNNTTIAGVGNGTVVELATDVAAINVVENLDQTTGKGVVIRDFKIDGRRDLYSAEYHEGIALWGIGSTGSSTAEAGALVTGMTIINTASSGVYPSGAENVLITNNHFVNNEWGIYVDNSSDQISITANNIESPTMTGIDVRVYSKVIVSNNAIKSAANSTGIYLNSTNNTVTDNNIIGGYYGIDLNNSADNNVITSNNISGALQTGLYILGDSNTVSDNVVAGSAASGIVLSSANGNNLNSNRVSNTGGASANDGIHLSFSDNNLIANNNITDNSCTTSCYAINISDATSDKNYLEGNRYSGSTANAASINDVGTGTIYVNQQTNTTTSTNSDVTDFRFRGSANSSTAFQVQNASGASVLTVDTANGELEVGSATLAGRLVISDGSSNNVTILAAPTAGDFTATIPTLAANDTFCMFGLNNCAGVNYWTDAGNHSYLTSTSDRLVVGSATDQNAKLAVVGAADEVQLLIKANATQSMSNPLVLLQNSSGSELARINATTTSLYFGNGAGGSNASGNDNTGIGASALGSVSTGAENTSLGSGALASVSVNSGNTAVGYNAGNLLTGTGNVLFGYQAGDNITTGSSNIIIGYDLDAASATGNNQLNIAGLLTSSNYTTGGQWNGTLTVTGNTTLNGNLTVDTNTLFVDAANNRVGIGTATPAYTLDVLNPSTSADTTNVFRALNGNSYGMSLTVGDSTYMDFATNNSGTAYIRNVNPNSNMTLSTARTLTLQTTSGAGSGLILNANGSGLAIQMQTLGVTRLQVDDAGVMVGNATTAGNLRISDGSNNNVSIQAQATAGNYIATIPTLTANDEFCMKNLTNCANSTAFVQDGNSFGAAATLGTNDAQVLNFETGGTTKMTLDTTGNLAVDTNTLYVDAANNSVGIATSTPDERLQVVGGNILLDNSRFLLFKDGAGTKRGVLSVNSGDDVVMGNATLDDIRFQTTAGTALILAKNTGDATLLGDLAVQGGDITSTGNLIIKPAGGNTTISSTLTVGTSDTTGTLLVLDTKTTAGDPTGVAGGMYYNSSLGRMRCYEGGAWVNCTPGASGGSLFTDGGEVTYLTTLTDKLSVGSSSDINGKLQVVGDVASESLAVFRAASGQTAATLLFEANDGTDLASTFVNANEYRIDRSGVLQNFAFGSGSYIALTTGNHNFAYGNEALRNITAGDDNIALGRYTARNTSTGFQNFAVTRGALYDNTTGANNIAIGRDALGDNISGNYNTALGYQAGLLSTGGDNIFIGRSAGDNLTTGSSNIIIGDRIGFASTTGSNQLNIAGLLQSSDYTSGSLSLGNGVTNAAPLSSVLQGTSSATAGVAGGSLTVRGGAGNGSANGGNLVLSGGQGGASGVMGLVTLAPTQFLSSGTTQSFAVNGSLSGVDSYSTIAVNASAANVDITVPAPNAANRVVGRILYVSAVNGTQDFDLILAGTSVSISMKANSTATLIWNGTGWTAAGASSSTDLQAAYNNTLSSAGGAEIVLNNTASANGLTVRNNATNPIIGAIFEAQTSIGSNLFSVNNNAVEYATNGGAETQGASVSTFPANTWSATPAGGTVARYTTAGDYVATGIGSVSVATSAADHGAANRLSTALTANLRYSVSFAVRGTSGFNSLNVYYSPDGTNTSPVQCVVAQTVTQGAWTRVNCYFDAPPSGITASNAIFIRQSDGAARTFYIENLSVTVKADVNHAADGSVEDPSFSTYWTSAPAGGTVSRDTSTIYDTSGSVRVVTGATAGHGVTNNMSITPTSNTQYLVTFFARSESAFGDIRVRYSRDGGTSIVPCIDYNTRTVAVGTWTKVTCLFTTDGTAPTNADLIIDQETGVARTFYIDALHITLNTNNASNVKIGGGSLGGPTTLLTLDRSAGPPIAANNDAYLGSMYYDTTTGRIQCYEAGGWGTCGAPPDNIVNLNPEYAGAVLNGTGIGTMQADVCANGGGLSINTGLCASGETRNFYRWTSPQASEQTYSIFVTYQLPSTFDGFANDDTVKLTGRVDNTTNAAVTYEMYRSQGGSITQCGSTATPVATSAGAWQTVGISGNEATGCGFNSSSANAFVLFKINLKARSNANAYVSTLTFTTTGR